MLIFSPMSLLTSLRNKSRHEKARIVWIACGVVTVILFVLWGLLGGINRDNSKDTSLFQIIGRGMRDLRENYK
jgi:hypothetical protein